jgi:hypothetical protein
LGVGRQPWARVRRGDDQRHGVVHSRCLLVDPAVQFPQAILHPLVGEVWMEPTSTVEKAVKARTSPT